MPVEAADLVIVEPDGTARRGAEDLLFPNGAVITPDGEHLIVAEGFRQVLTEFSIDSLGNLTNRRIFADLAGEIPDGIALDVESGVWVAQPLRQEFVRVERGGNVTERISSAPSGAFACALGGENRRTLFMCTALGEQEQIRNGQSKGQILQVEVSIPGAGRP
jgi:sugar lactone lactonase YvrE